MDMTPEQQAEFTAMQEHCAKMDRFWFQTDTPNAATRAEQLDRILFLSKWTGMSGKILMAVSGVVITISAAYFALVKLLGVGS